MSLDLLKKRLSALGGNAENRMTEQKLKSLNKALLYSYQGETIVKDGVEIRCLINNNKLKMDYDDKIISVPYESGIKVGDIFYWGKTDEHWIVYLRHFSEDSYFRGYIRKAHHVLRWQNKYGKELEVHAAVRGPVETKIKGEFKSNISFDLPNYTLSMIIPNNKDTSILKRYSKVFLNDEVWEVAVADSINEPGVIELQLIEALKNKDEDTTVVGGLIKPEIKVFTSLDNLNVVKAGAGIELGCNIYVNGVENKELEDSAIFSVESGDAIIESNCLFVNSGEATISFAVEDSETNKEFKVVASETQQEMNVVYIEGDNIVKGYGKAKYTIAKYESGERVQGNGEWRFSDFRHLYSVVESNSDFIEFKWVNGAVGRFSFDYVENGVVLSTKSVKLESLI